MATVLLDGIRSKHFIVQHRNRRFTKKLIRSRSDIA